jgi:two-component system sensor histidine kinase TctE
VDLAALTRETGARLRAQGHGKRIDLGYEGPDDGRHGRTLMGQPTLVRELVRNLVDNALQYTPAAAR